MTDISKKLEKTLRSAIVKNPLIPVRTKEGILVGDVIIKNEGTVKHLWQNNVLIYKEVSLNIAAIKLANMLAKRELRIHADKLYAADQIYGKWFIDSQMLRTQYELANKNRNFDRADILWARYCESRDRAIIAKHEVEHLSLI